MPEVAAVCSEVPNQLIKPLINPINPTNKRTFPTKQTLQGADEHQLLQHAKFFSLLRGRLCIRFGPEEQDWQRCSEEDSAAVACQGPTNQQPTNQLSNQRIQLSAIRCPSTRRAAAMTRMETRMEKNKRISSSSRLSADGPIQERVCNRLWQRRKRMQKQRPKPGHLPLAENFPFRAPQHPS